MRHSATTAARPSRATAPMPPATHQRDAEPDGVLSPAATVWHAFLLRKAAQRVTALADVVLGPQGLTLRHFGLLLVVDDEPGLKQRMVGERLRIDRTTVVSLVDDLEAAGLLRRHRGTDRRTFSLFLTTAGTTRLDQLRRMIGEVHEEFLAPLSAAERETLHDLLTKLTA